MNITTCSDTNNLQFFHLISCAHYYSSYYFSPGMNININKSNFFLQISSYIIYKFMVHTIIHWTEKGTSHCTFPRYISNKDILNLRPSKKNKKNQFSLKVEKKFWVTKRLFRRNFF